MKSPEGFNQLEKDILEWIIADTEDETVREQLRKVVFLEREYTGVGSFTYIAIPSETVLKAGLISGSMPIEGPHIKSPLLDYGALSLIFFKKGIITDLEIAAYGDSFPENLEEYFLYKAKVTRVPGK